MWLIIALLIVSAVYLWPTPSGYAPKSGAPFAGCLKGGKDHRKGASRYK